MQVSIYCEFGLKTPIHAPKMGIYILGEFNPLNGEQCQCNSKRHLFVQKHVI